MAIREPIPRLVTKEESFAQQEADQFFKSLPPQVRVNTISTERLKHFWLENSPKQLAITFVDCVNCRAWEAIAYMPAVPSKREVRSYDPLTWMRQCIGIEPDEFMRVIAGHLPDAEVAATAARQLIDIVKENEPETFFSYLADMPNGSTNIPGWRTLLKSKSETVNGGWTEAAFYLDEAVKQPVGTNRYTRTGSAPDSGALTPDPAVGKNRCPKDDRTRTLRRLARLKGRPEECKAKGTTVERVEKAHARLARGLTPSVQAALREAGLATKQPNGGVGIRGKPEEVASRIIKEIGAARAEDLAKAILAKVAVR